MKAMAIGCQTYGQLDAETQFDYPGFRESQKKESESLNLHILSLNKREKLVVHRQNDLVQEFMKVMSLAHECVQEKNGEKVFY